MKQKNEEEKKRKIKTPRHKSAQPANLQIVFDQKPHKCLPSVILNLLDHYNHAFIASIWSW